MSATTPARPPVPGAPAPSDAVAGLARQMDRLRADVDALGGLPARVEEVAGLVAQVANAVAALSSRPAPQPAPSWLRGPTDPDLLGQWVGELATWMHAIFLRYRDGADALPECWLHHAEVVEELVWLMHAWLAAYQGPAASVQLASDWHDRQRPGAVRRIRGYAGSCSFDSHRIRPEWDQKPTGAASVPGLAAVPEMARWWAERRDDPSPEPTLEGETR